MKLSVRFTVLERDGFRCRYCGTSPATTELHIDHVVPRALGGCDHLHNLVTACSACNLGKAATPLRDRPDDRRVTDALLRFHVEKRSEALALLARFAAAHRCECELEIEVAAFLAVRANAHLAQGLVPLEAPAREVPCRE